MGEPISLRRVELMTGTVGLGTQECRCECRQSIAPFAHRSQVHESKTIEGDVFEALTKAGAVSAENSTDHRKVDVHRAARTDAGVHAAGNV